MEHTNTMEDTHTQESTQTREDRHTHEMHINESILSKEILEDQKKNRIDHMTYLPGMEDIGSEILDQVVEKMNAYDYDQDRKSTRLNSSHITRSRMPSSA